ncbi:MAG: tetratricopeptide repeat protein [Gemmatimonadota bacterium]
MTRYSLLLLLALLPGCAYYNGMYNANRLAHEAEKAEREGRTFDAASLWGQVGVKADTMLARHSGSKWADDARLLRGKSFQRLGDCNSAVTILREVIATSPDSGLVEEGSFLLGRCYQSLGNSEEAGRAFARLINSSDPARRKEALYQHGRSLRLGGRYDQAVEVLSRTDDPRARGELAVALAGVGRVDEAALLADSLIAAGDTLAPWDSMMVLIGRKNPSRATEIADRLIAIPQASGLQKAMWMLDDAERLLPTDPARGETRADEAIRLETSGPANIRGRLILLEVRMVRASNLDSLRALRGDLDGLTQTGGATGLSLGRLSRAAAVILNLADSAAAGATSPDMRLFLAAETARDSLLMHRLAFSVFREVTENYSASSYAPKALLAMIALDSASASSTDSLLHARYPDSPYLLAALGQESPGFSALEDSLLVFSNNLRRVRQTTPNRPGVRPNSTSGVPDN